jgi:transposase
MTRCSAARPHAWAALWTEYKRLYTLLVEVVGRDELCGRFCAIPGVGPVAALTFKAAIDDPARLPNRRRSAPILG